MKEYIKSSWKFLLFVLCSGLIGGYCTGLYIPEMYSQEMLQQLQEQGMTAEMSALSGAVQYGILYGVILGAIGLLISKKVGLWKEFRFDKNISGIAENHFRSACRRSDRRSDDETVLHVSAGTHYFETVL